MVSPLSQSSNGVPRSASRAAFQILHSGIRICFSQPVPPAVTRPTQQPVEVSSVYEFVFVPLCWWAGCWGIAVSPCVLYWASSIRPVGRRRQFSLIYIGHIISESEIRQIGWGKQFTDFSSATRKKHREIWKQQAEVERPSTPLFRGWRCPLILLQPPSFAAGDALSFSYGCVCVFFSFILATVPPPVKMRRVYTLRRIFLYN